MERAGPALKLQRSPLVMVLAQVRFSPVTKIADYVPEIQDRLRQGGFPRLTEGQAHEVTVGPQGTDVCTHPRWELQDKPRRTGFVLSQNFLVLHTNDYDRFEPFAETLARVLRTVADVMKPHFVARLGLRYVNLLVPGDAESWRDYLKEGLHGLDADRIGISQGVQRSETVGTTDHGTLVVRCVQTRNGSFLPPDLSPSNLDYSHLPPAELKTFLDFDHYSERERDFEPDALVGDFWILHDNLDLSFREAVTEHAMRAWEAEES